MELFLKTFFMVLLVELGSTSQFTIAAISAHSEKPFIVWLAAILALATTCVMAILLGEWISNLPFSPNLISGVIMISVGIFLLWKI